jgi:NAD(P)-dependent dehydrogenase (short-subunit alcohol dehydrogenase family)
MSVVAVDRNRPALDGLPDGIACEAVDAIYPIAAAPIVERIAREVGPPDWLVNTIGALHTADALSTTPDLLRLMIDANLVSALRLSHAVAPYMPRKGSGAHHRAHRRPA